MANAVIGLIEIDDGVVMMDWISTSSCQLVGQRQTLLDAGPLRDAVCDGFGTDAACTTEWQPADLELLQAELAAEYRQFVENMPAK